MHGGVVWVGGGGAALGRHPHRVGVEAEGRRPLGQGDAEVGPPEMNILIEISQPI